MQYVECIRKYVDAPEMTLETAVELAINECIEKGILSDFLRKNRAEAMSISIFEYNEAEEKEKLRKAEYQGGYEDGVLHGIQQGIQQGVQMGRNEDILALISDYIDDNLPIQKMIEKLQKIFNLSEEEAYSHYEAYTRTQQKEK